MMKIIAVLSVVLAVAICAPQEYAQQQQPEVTVVKYENNNDGSGNYNFVYDLSDGQHRDETGTLKQIQNEEGETNEAVVMTGSYSWVDEEGKTHTVTYTADENGYHPIVSK